MARTYGKPVVDFVATYNTALSKNARRRWGRGARVYTPKLAQEAEATLTAELTKALGRKRFYQNKVYISMHVYKSRTNVDCINFLDAVADVTKVVIKVDDKYFSVKEIDWTVDRVHPRIHIQLYQPDRFDLT